MFNKGNISPIVIVLIIVIILGIALGIKPIRQKIFKHKNPATTNQPYVTPSTGSIPTDETANWKTYNNIEFGYTINYPTEFQVTGEKEHIILMKRITEPGGVPNNFVTITVLTKPGDDVNILFNTGVGKTAVFNPDLVEYFSYVRYPDTTIAGMAAKVYFNKSPYEFGPGVKEYRYYINRGGNIYFIDGFIENKDNSQIDYISEQLFQRILSTFKFTQ